MFRPVLPGLLGAAVLAVFAAAYGTSVDSAPLTPSPVQPAPERIVLGVDGTGEIRNLPVLVAERLGYFRDEGLTVTLVDSPAEPSPADLMRDGRADGAVAFYHHTFMSQADDGRVTQAVAVLGVTPALKLLVAERLRGKVTKLADLKGLKIYTGGSNSGKTTAANWLVLAGGHGIGDYTPLQPASRELMLKALRSGEADAIVSHEPDADLYESSGAAFVLADLETPQGARRSLGALFPSTALYLPKSFVTAHPAAVQRLVNACLRALDFINSHTPEQIAALLPPKIAGKDKAGFLHLLGEDKAMFATDGLMPGADARRELEVMAALTPKYRRVRFEETYTNGFVQAYRAHGPAKAKP